MLSQPALPTCCAHVHTALWWAVAHWQEESWWPSVASRPLFRLTISLISLRQAPLLRARWALHVCVYVDCWGCWKRPRSSPSPFLSCCSLFGKGGKELSIATGELQPQEVLPWGRSWLTCPSVLPTLVLLVPPSTFPKHGLCLNVKHERWLTEHKEMPVALESIPWSMSAGPGFWFTVSTVRRQVLKSSEACTTK